MATALANSCSVCAENYSQSRRCVKLSCYHQFCSVCIGRIEKTSRRCCPICRQQWTKDLVDTDEISKLLIEAKDKEQFYKKILNQEQTCVEHCLPMQLWCHDCSVLLCRKCVASKHKKDNWDNIEDCVPVVEKNSNDSCQDIVKKMMEVQDKSRNDSGKMRKVASSIEKFVEKLMEVHRLILIDVEKEEDSAAKRNEFTSDVLTFQEKIKDMDRTNAANIFNYVQTLVKKAKDLETSTSGNESSLLANIVMSYFNEVDEGTNDAVSFIRSLGLLEEVDLLLYEDVQRSLADMEYNNIWTVDSRASAAAATILTAQHKRPTTLKLEFSPSQPCMPLSAATQVLAAVGDCNDVRMYCWDTFYFNTQNGIGKSRELLSNLKEHNGRCTLTTFFGHLDCTLLSELPDTIHTLGLAIASSDDAATVAALKPWRRLESLSVSVSSTITAEQLPPLPSNNDVLWLHVPHFQDERVDAIPEYINSLRPGRSLGPGLYFPACQLTVSGAERLSQLLEWRPGTIEINKLYIDGGGGRLYEEIFQRLIDCFNVVKIHDEPYALIYFDYI